MPIEHYENFPVASVLVPRRLRPAVEAIYWFARSADDLADEGTATPDERIAALAAYDAQLMRIAHGQAPAATPEGAGFENLAARMRDHALPVQPFRDLLSAFTQDATVRRYEDDAALLDYCRRSANPVGRLILILHGADEARHRLWSDRICTALQWINFWQDVEVDLRKDRVYLPRVDRARFDVTEAMLAGDPRTLTASAAWKSLMAYEVARTRAMMLEGSALPLALPGRVGFELRLVVHGGLRILEKIEQVDYDVFARRPTIGKSDGPLLGWRALAYRAAPESAPTIRA